MINWISLGVLLLVSGLAVVMAVRPLRKQRYVWMVAPLLLGAAGLGYWYWGAWQAQSEFIQRNDRQRAAEALLPTIKSPEVLIKKLQQHLAIDPSSARGWYLLGRLYASQHLWEKSYQALGKAYELKPQDDLIAVNFAQSLFARQNPEDDALARKILTATLVAHPQQADALLMLAIDAQHRHATQEALTYWRRLLILVPDSSPEAESIRKTIHDLMGSE